MCRINRLSLGCAHALDPVMLVEAKVELAWNQFFLVSANMASYSSVSHSRKDENSE